MKQKLQTPNLDRYPYGVSIIGLQRRWKSDLYHYLLRARWRTLLVFIFGFYVATNILFAVLYLLGGDAIANARPRSFTDAFFFSVQTLATIGYGGMYPKTFYANIIVSIEAVFGMLAVAFATGLAFAKFSRPTARVMFSKAAVVCAHDGKPHLMFRMANARANQIVEANLSVVIIRNEVTAEGERFRRVYDLNLRRSNSPVFALTWTAMHAIDDVSPLKGETHASLLASKTEILASLVGIDETISQQIHARHSYRADNIFWNHRLIDIFQPDENKPVIDYTNFHETKAIKTLAIEHQ